MLQVPSVKAPNQELSGVFLRFNWDFCLFVIWEKTGNWDWELILLIIVNTVNIVYNCLQITT